MVEDKKVIDSDFIVKLFGSDSQIYKERVQNFKRSIERRPDLQEKFERFKILYNKVYGNQPNYDLLIKHSYYIQILKLILIKKISIIKRTKVEDVYDSDLDDDFKDFQEFYFNVLDASALKEIFALLENADFSCEDLFHKLYQHIFFSHTRHQLGEFYTSKNLVKMMVDDFYAIGKKVLDPACGSGTFLVEILLKILNSKETRNTKIDAINKIYGFDVNPVATLTTKVNLKLIILNHLGNVESILKGPIIYFTDALFPNKKENGNLENTFDLIIGNPPWLTYKDIYNKTYQQKVRDLADSLEIKPPSQYITHIELAAIFFYAIPTKYLKLNGKIFFVITRSVLNGDHCYRFRKFSIFDNVEIWDFPKNYFFNVDHICLKARYIGINSNKSLKEKYPIPTKIFNENLELQETTNYDSILLEEKGAKIIISKTELNNLNTLSMSNYKKLFFQGATLVPRSLVFFKINQEDDNFLEISSDLDILTRVKKNWVFKFEHRQIEKRFRFKTFLNIDMIPFYIKKLRNVFLPIDEKFEFNFSNLKRYPKAFGLYNELNEIYKSRKKLTSKIETLFSNLNYWNKLSKQYNNKRFIVVYNASGSMIKAAVIDNQEKNIIIGSENYYLSTDLPNEAYFLSSILNSNILSKNIRLIKSSRHIHKRPFSFPIPIYNNENLLHRNLANKGKKYETVVQDLFFNNPKISSSKVRIFINKKLQKLDTLTKQVIFEI